MDNKFVNFYCKEDFTIESFLTFVFLLFLFFYLFFFVVVCFLHFFLYSLFLILLFCHFRFVFYFWKKSLIKIISYHILVWLTNKQARTQEFVLKSRLKYIFFPNLITLLLPFPSPALLAKGRNGLKITNEHIFYFLLLDAPFCNICPPRRETSRW